MKTDEKKIFWEELISEFEKSNSSLSYFCKTWGVPTWKFHYWRRKLRSDEVGFVKLDVIDIKEVKVSKEQAVGILIHSGTFTIEIENGFNEQTLKRLLDCLAC